MNIIAPINQLGYGQVGTHLTVALSKSVDVSLFPIGQNYECHPKHHSIIQECLERAKFYDVDEPCLRIWHQFDLSHFVGKSKHIGFPIFELDNFTTQELHHLYACDGVFVCSEWAKSVVDECVYNAYKCVGSNVKVVPLGVDLDIFYPQESKRKSTIFLNIGKWEKRKGHDILIDAFNSAFEHTDDVELWMMCDNPFLSSQQTSEWISRYRNSKLGTKVRFIPRQPSQEDVANVIRQADCGVFPSRAEGWNLEALEMMACGKAIIITNYSGHTEFCNASNSELINIDDVELANDGIWFHDQGHWANIDQSQIEQIIEKMRKIHLDKTQHGGIMNNGGIATASEFTWDNSASIVLNNI